MNIAIICRQAIYDRLSKPITTQNADVIVSPALFQWNEALQYLQTNKVDGIVLEEGVTFFNEIKSMPLPMLTYTSNSGYGKLVNDWIQSLRVEIEKRNKQFRKEAPPKPEQATFTKQDKGKEGIKVTLVSNTKDLINFIPSIQEVNVIRNISDPQLVLSVHELVESEVVLIEEGVFGQDPTTVRDLKILQIIDDLKGSQIRIALLLFQRPNKKLTTRLIDKGFYNFIAGTDLDAKEVEDLIKRPFTREDVKDHYQGNLLDREENLKALELLQRTEHLVAHSEENRDAEQEQTKESISDNNSELVQEKSETVVDTATKDNKEKVEHKQKESKPEWRDEIKREEQEEFIEEQRSATLENIAGTFKKMPNIFGFLTKREENEKRDKPPVTSSNNQHKNEEDATSNIFLEGVPHRLVLYSPKGGGNATAVATQLAEASKNNSVGVVEIAYSYGQMAGRLDIQPDFTLIDLEDGMEEYAVCKDRYLLAPWVYPVKRSFNEAVLMEWLGRAQRAFSGRTIIADLQSQSSPIIQYYSLQWATRVIWTVLDTKDHLGMADIQLSQLKKMGDSEWQKIGILVQETTGVKLPWEEVLGVPVIGVLPKERQSKKWKTGLYSSVAKHLGLSMSAMGAKGVLGKLR